ncbi:MAG: cphA [Cyanobacteria bacterium RYN_339]|nr:cphA [Cyanobacteria bacterium RYN_339]
MQILETRILRGPNVYAATPCFLAVIDLGEHAGTRLPAHEAFDLPAGLQLAEAVAGLLAWLQRQVGHDVALTLARPVPRREGHWEVVAGYRHEPLVDEAFPIAVAVTAALARGEVPDLAADLARLRDLALRGAIGPSTRAIVEAAERLGIPVFRVTEQASLFQLGWGKHAKRIQATVTSNTCAIATEIAQDKDLTKGLLAEAGLPVPRGHIAYSADEAVEAARRLGGPVAVKPLDGNQGKGVSLNLTDPEQIRAAFELARGFRRRVLVESFVEGRDYRVLVVGDQVVAAAHRLPAQVLGDGALTVRQLVERENTNPDRGEGHSKPMTFITLDDAAAQVLQRQQLTFDQVPARDQVVVLKENANLSTGGTAEDVTHLIHPANALACVRAARKIGLDVAGIDVVCKDIAVPLAEQHGALIEVNAAPGIRMHQHPAKGEPHDVGAAIVASLFPAGSPARVPVLAVTGTNGKTTTTHMIAHVLQAAGTTTGTTTSEGIYIDGREVQAGDCTGYWSARTVLTDPAVEAAVLEVARGGIFKRGLAFDQCDVGVVLNVADDHLGQHGAETLEDLAAVKALIARQATRAVVLNAEDPLVAAMAAQARPGAEVLFFSLDPHHPTLHAHLDAGGRAVYLRRRMVMLAQGDHRLPLVEVDHLPCTLGGRARHNVANALAAMAALLGLGHQGGAIVQALATFNSSAAQNPGRLNTFHVRDFQVLLDYAHNPAGYAAIIETARALPHRRLIGVVGAPGDRYDAKIREIGAVVGRGFDELVLRDMAGDLRGRATGEVPGLLLEGIRDVRQDLDHVHTVLDEHDAVERALALAGPGDLVIVTAVDIHQRITQLQRHASGAEPGFTLNVTMLPEARERQPDS